MNSPIRVGLVARFSDQWAAGLYYVENILAALLTLEGVEVTVLLDSGQRPSWTLSRLKNANIRYKELDPSYNLFERLGNGVATRVLGRRLVERRVRSTWFDVVFPEGRTGEYPFQLLKQH